MDIFSTLEEARATGMYLGRFGQYPTIYKRGTKDYIVVEKGEWPPSKSWPFLKWDGDNWVPVLAKLETVEQAQEASDLFSLLGHNTVIVEFPGITFDIFFREAHVPTGAWIVSESDSHCFVRYMKSPESVEDSEDYESEVVDFEIVPM